MLINIGLGYVWLGFVDLFWLKTLNKNLLCKKNVLESSARPAMVTVKGLMQGSIYSVTRDGHCAANGDRNQSEDFCWVVLMQLPDIGLGTAFVPWHLSLKLSISQLKLITNNVGSLKLCYQHGAALWVVPGIHKSIPLRVSSMSCELGGSQVGLSLSPLVKLLL